MDPQFILFGVILIFVIAVLSVKYERKSNPTSVCSKKLNETCILQNECCYCKDDCCTQFCYKYLWVDNGRCVNPSKSTAIPANIDKCKRLGDNTCVHNNECCSRNCFKKPDWKMGICKKTLSKTTEYERFGRCSYYDGGGLTASGEPFRPLAMTAAHRTLPFNTTVRVTTAGGRSVVVRVNDRGPFVHGRILDLSRGAAERLGTVHMGVAPCEIMVLGGDGDRACKKNWDNTCTKNGECCSRNCDRPPVWAQGVCKPAPQYVTRGQP